MISFRAFSRVVPAVVLLLQLPSTPSAAQSSRNDQSPPDLVLEGDVYSFQRQTYFEVPFSVPPGVHRVSVDFAHTGRDQHTTLDLGIADPYRFRGNSGGNKNHFTIAETDATPSYLPGAIPPGRWKLLIAAPNIRSRVTAHYRAEVRFNNAVEDSAFIAASLAIGAHWYRGDLHMHTAHSDGSCDSQSGKRVPCPVFLTVQAAADRSLDFIAISDHNTDSQNDALRELQPYFDRVLLIPAREVTTFRGHFNVFGVTKYIDYRVDRNGRTVDDVLQDALALGGIASINHADAPSGEICVGCGWTPSSPVDMDLFTGVEVVNGGNLLLSTDIWDKQIGQGHRLTALGGSDNHNALIPAGHPAAIGRPTTVVEANELSVSAILNGIRRGRAFIDLSASRDKLIDMEVRSGAATARMGENLYQPTAAPVDVDVHVAGCTGDTLHILIDGRESAVIAPIAITEDVATLHARWQADGRRHWLRAEVRGTENALILLSNPIYVNFPTP